MPKRLLTNLTVSAAIALLVGCTAHAPRYHDPGLGIAQVAHGDYVVCDICPVRTQKTQYRAAPPRQVTGDDGRTPHAQRMSPSATRPYKAGHMVTASDSGPLLTIHFPFGVSAIPPSEQEKLQRFAARIRATLPSKDLLIVGRTDKVGTKHHNDELARKRAESVAAALRALGIESVRTRSEGKCCYVGDNSTADGRARNRRAEIAVYRTQPQETTE